MECKPLYAVAVQYEGEDAPVILRKNISHRMEMVVTEYDTTRFSLPPSDAVYLVKISSIEILEKDQGLSRPIYPDQTQEITL